MKTTPRPSGAHRGCWMSRSRVAVTRRGSSRSTSSTLACRSKTSAFAEQIAVRSEQAGHLVLWSYRTPTVGLPFAVQREVKPQISVGMRLRVVGDFGQPGARDHDAR